MARTPAPRSTAHRLTTAALALLVGLTGLTTLGATATAAPGGGGDRPAPGSAGGDGRVSGCETYLLDAPQPARRARASLGRGFGVAAARNATTPAALRAEAADPALWLDRCGRAFYADPAHGASVHVEASAAEAPTTAAALSAPLSETFALNSRPGAARTIYLDFRGGSVSGTAWNESYGSPITVAPYSITAPADTSFTTAELTEIQRAWQVVAEDYAPFDVNVTTQDPGAGALDRTSTSDSAYGTRVMVTGGGPIYQDCGCGGVAYVDVFDLAGAWRAHYQPAWVFTDGTGTAGKSMAEAISHEAGHNFGLDHDATSTRSYYSGSSPWAPVMGSGYSQPVTQWSRGEYPDASMTEDDVAIIASGAPLRADDHGTGAAATVLTPGTPVRGVIGTRADVDGFAFTGSGQTTVTATVADYANVDLHLQVVAGDGTVVADVDPAVRAVSRSVADGLDASWSGTLPAAGEYRVVLDGVGSGDPLTAGRYSDYGSLGAYELSVETAPVVERGPLVAEAGPAPEATVAQPFHASVAAASGGSEPYRWTATGLPTGLGVDAASGAISGIPAVAGRWTATLTVTDASGATATADVALVVRHPAVTTADQSFATVAGEPLTGRLRAAGGDGSYTWSAVSDLPSWLALDSDGTLRGTPAAPGRHSFGVAVRSDGRTARATVTVTVAATPVVVVDQAFAGTAGAPFSARLVATGGEGAHDWSAGAVPSWLALSATGELSGTPTGPGTWSFPVTATAGGTSGSATVTVRVEPAAVTPVSVPDQSVRGRVGRAIDVPLLASGGGGALTWGLAPGAALPSGLRLEPTGRLRGKPRRAGTYRTTVVAVSAAAAVSGSGVVTIRIARKPLRIKTRWLPTGTTGREFRARVVTAGADIADGPVRWSRRGWLPRGLSTKQAWRGRVLVVQGTPRRAGRWRVRLRAVDASGRAVSRVVTIRVGRR